MRRLTYIFLILVLATFSLQTYAESAHCPDISTFQYKDGAKINGVDYVWISSNSPPGWKTDNALYRKNDIYLIQAFWGANLSTNGELSCKYSVGEAGVFDLIPAIPIVVKASTLPEPLWSKYWDGWACARDLTGCSFEY